MWSVLVSIRILFLLSDMEIFVTDLMDCKNCQSKGEKSFGRKALLSD
jgi:hypothetical protein